MTKEKEIIDEIIKRLKNTKVYAKKWKGKYSMYFKEEFEDYPEVEKTLRVFIGEAVKLTIKELKK